MHCTTRAPPREKTMLRIGELNAAAIAIFGWPRLASTVFATASPTELPHANTVIPKMELDTFLRVQRLRRKNNHHTSKMIRSRRIENYFQIECS